MAKKIKTTIMTVALIAVALAAILAFSACGEKDEVESEEMINYTSYSSIPYVEDGTSEQVLDIHIPDTDDENERMPLLVCIHGGMFTTGRTTMSTVSQVYEYFANRGYVCASLQYTMGVGTYPAAVIDCKTAVQYLVDNADTYKIDTSRIVLYGESAGSYLACLTSLTGPSDFKRNEDDPDYTFEVSAYVDFYGPVMVGNGETDSGAADWMGDATAPDLTEYFDGTAVTHIWIQQGDSDVAVDYNHSVTFKALLEESGKYSESDGTLYYEIIEGAGHMDSAFFTDENLAKLYSWLGDAL